MKCFTVSIAFGRRRSLPSTRNLHLEIFCPQPNPLIWQRNYYESIVGDEKQLARIREYILNNPQKWEEEPEKPQTDSQELLIDFIF